jgi:hypothetical protein
MAKPLVLVMLLSLLGCANMRVNRAALVASTLALACDAGQTMRAARGGWDGQAEGNPIMGPAPDQAMVAGYFVGAIAVNTLAWLVTPDKYRAVLPAAVVGVQARVIVGNASNNTGWCGL